MKHLNTDNFGECYQPETFEEIIELIPKDDTEAINEPYLPTRIWRGQADITWKIHSSAYRRLENENNVYYHGNIVSESDMISYEKKLITQATHKGFRNTNYDNLTDFELLARLQHHGAATRLIDFTRNAFVALWFCVSDFQDKNGFLIGTNYDLLGGYESRRIEGVYDDVMEAANDSTIVYDPPQITNRISAQNAQFLFSKVVHKKEGSIDLKNEIFIAISAELKKRVQHILNSSFGFDTYFLFPDIDGFGISNSAYRGLREMGRSNLIFGGEDRKS